MRREEADLEMRVVLGEEAKALVAAVLPPGQKAGSRDLENGIQHLKREIAIAQGQAEGARTVVSEVTARLEGMIRELKEEHSTVLMVLGKAHRELFLIRQLVGLITLENKDEAQEVIERLRARDQQWEEFMHSAMPNATLTFPAYQADQEIRALRQLTVEAINSETRVKPHDKAKQGEKEQERER